MTIEDKIREIALAPVKEGDFMVITTDEYFYNLCVKAYNLGLDIAVENIDLNIDTFDEMRKSILKWKITI